MADGSEIVEPKGSGVVSVVGVAVVEGVAAAEDVDD
jgi:hypothetical protein